MGFSLPFTIFLVCAYGVIKEFRPATPFLSAFLRTKNFTNVELYSQVYPYWTYSYLAFLVPIFFITDRLKYKPVVVLEAATLTGTWALLVFGNTLWQMQLMQILFGLASSAEIAYYSYLYAVVDRKNFKKVTAYIRSAVLLGKFFGYTVAQTLISTHVGSYLLLNQITLVAVSTTFIISVILQFYNVNDNKVGDSDNLSHQEDNFTHAKNANTTPAMGPNVFKELYEALKDPVVLIWSVWWALASCGTFQVMNYAQSLWAPMHDNGQFMGNGLMECVATLTSTFLTFMLQYTNFNWKLHGSKVFFFASLISALLLCGMAKIQIIWFSYLFYIINSALYHVLIAAASNTIAAQLHSSKYSLVFGFNTFIALALQTVLTIAVADKSGLHLDIITQFYVYGGYFAVLAVIFVPTAFLHQKFCGIEDEKTENSSISTDGVNDNDYNTVVRM